MLYFSGTGSCKTPRARRDSFHRSTTVLPDWSPAACSSSRSVSCFPAWVGDRLRNRLALALTMTCLGVAFPLAQAASRVATTTDLLLAYPVFFHGKQVVVRSAVELAGSLSRLTTPQAVDTSGKKPAAIFVF